jgi:hypothetical protein
MMIRKTNHLNEVHVTRTVIPTIYDAVFNIFIRLSMLITSISFESNFVPDLSEYWVYFKSEIIVGEALFFPSKQFQEGSELLYVEVEHREIKDFKVLPSNTAGIYRVEALPHRGDYQVIGQVSSIMIDDDDNSIQSIGVCVDAYTCSTGSFTFCLSSEEMGAIAIVENDWVEFVLIGLSLWDTNT